MATDLPRTPEGQGLRAGFFRPRGAYYLRSLSVGARPISDQRNISGWARSSLRRPYRRIKKVSSACISIALLASVGPHPDRKAPRNSRRFASINSSVNNSAASAVERSSSVSRAARKRSICYGEGSSLSRSGMRMLMATLAIIERISQSFIPARCSGSISWRVSGVSINRRTVIPTHLLQRS